MQHTAESQNHHNGYEDTNEEQSEIGDETNDIDDTINGDDDERETVGGINRQYAMPDEPTNYSLFTNPPSLGSIRQRLFDIEDEIELSPADFEAYFPFVDNVWRKVRGGEQQKDDTAVTEYYWCRLRKTSNQKPHVPRPTPAGKQSRRKRTKEDKACGMALKVVFTEGVVKRCRIMRAVGKDETHSHDLDYMDSQKRNGAIMDVARREAVRGFLPGSVFAKMKEEPDKMAEAGGKYMKISDVRNVQYAWRQENPNVILKTHTGYTQSRPIQRLKPLGSPKHLHSSTPPTQFLNPSRPTTSSQPLQPLQPLQQLQPHPSPPIAVMPDRKPPSSTTLQYPEHARTFLEPYLFPQNANFQQGRPHVTLTWATSLDSRIALLPGTQTVISGPETKAMTHYLRSRHDAIVIGVNTAIADDPALNCRLAGAGGYGGPQGYMQPRPIIIDPHARLRISPEMKILRMVAQGCAKAPWVVVGAGAMIHQAAVTTLKHFGGEYLMVNEYQNQTGGFEWEGIFNILFRENIRSIMIEGGGKVLSELLQPRYSHLITSLVLTIAPTFFGSAGVAVVPETTFDEQRKPIATRLKNVRWQPMGDADVVMCGHTIYEAPEAILPGIDEFSHAAASGETNRAETSATIETARRT